VDILCCSPGIPCLKTRFPSPDLATNEPKTRLNGGALSTDTTAKMATIVITTSTQKKEFLNKKHQKMIQGIGLFQ
jgi:hypothetical protein